MACPSRCRRRPSGTVEQQQRHPRQVEGGKQLSRGDLDPLCSRHLAGCHPSLVLISVAVAFCGRVMVARTSAGIEAGTWVALCR